MSKTREIQCVYYIAEGRCAIGREGTFRNQCQICNKYKAKAGAKPARTDTRRQKLDKANKKERGDY